MQVTLANDNEMHKAVNSLYANAAIEPQPGLCCPKDYESQWSSHIPKEAFEYNYGCGSPVTKANIAPGETVLDLGSGVGIDCFVAAKMVSKSGKVIGLDMTDEMLDKANAYKTEVAETLGYDVVEFKKGHIEQIPLDDNSVDVVMSNCVLNLSTDKNQVFSEIHRVLKDAGRLVISDIVSDRTVDIDSKNDQQLWAECYTGALSVSEFIELYRHSGFDGVTQISEAPWEEVNGYTFASLTIEGYKFRKGSSCNYVGNKAIYLGPYGIVYDEEGHEFKKFNPVEICSDTAHRLQNYPYKGSFIVTDATRVANVDNSCCAPKAEESCCGTDTEQSCCEPKVENSCC